MNHRTKKLMIVSALTVLTIVLYAQPLYAGSLSNDITGQYTKGAAAAELGAVSDPQTAITGIIQEFLKILGTVFLVLTVYAGFQMMTARGDEGKVEKAQKTIQAAIIGLVIILAAYSITYFVGKATTDAVTGKVQKVDPGLKWSDL